MKRWLLALVLVFVPALGVFIPASAQADTADSGQLISGQPTVVTIATAGQQPQYTFAAQAGRHVTFQVTAFDFTDGSSAGSVNLYFYEPGSSGSYTSCYFANTGYCDFTPPETGTWSVTVDPSSASVGSLTLTFANDVATRALTAGTAVTTAIKFQGQNAGYTFAGKAHKRVLFQVAKFHFTVGASGGSVYLYFYEPGSSGSYTSCYIAANTSCTFKTPVGGRCRATLDPIAGGASFPTSCA